MSNSYTFTYLLYALQLTDKEEKEEDRKFMIDGWNAWFYDDLDSLVGCCKSRLL